MVLVRGTKGMRTRRMLSMIVSSGSVAVGYVFENRLRGDELDILVLSDEKVVGA